MIDILFGDSAAGGLEYARACSEKLKNSDIACLGVMADIGDISKPMFGEYRARLLYKMLYQKQWGDDPEMAEDLKRLGGYYTKNAAKVKRAVLRGETVRVWTDSAPYSLCGMLWLSGLLAKHKAEVYAVELPKFSENGNALTRFTGWGECEPEYFVKCLPLARRVSQIELLANSMEWRRLKSENASLRAVITDRVLSVPASFYDFLIWKYIGNSPITEAMLIGKILGENQLGVGDCWYAQRIEHFIRKGKIAVVEDSEKKYARVIVRA